MRGSTYSALGITLHQTEEASCSDDSEDSVVLAAEAVAAMLGTTELSDQQTLINVTLRTGDCGPPGDSHPSWDSRDDAWMQAGCNNGQDSAESWPLPVSEASDESPCCKRVVQAPSL